MTIGLRVGGQAFLVQPGQDEAVDGVRIASRLAHDGERRALGPDEGPVRLVGGTLLDPALEQGSLARREGLVRLGRGHDLLGIGGGDPPDEGALRGVPLDDDRLAVGTGRERELGSIQAELRLSRSRVGAVAAEAVVDENRTDVFVERDGAGKGQGQGRLRRGRLVRRGRLRRRFGLAPGDKRRRRRGDKGHRQDRREQDPRGSHGFLRRIVNREAGTQRVPRSQRGHRVTCRSLRACRSA